MSKKETVKVNHVNRFVINVSNLFMSNAVQNEKEVEEQRNWATHGSLIQMLY